MSSSLAAFPLTSRPAAPPSRAARTPAPPRPAPAPAPAPPVPPAVRHRVPHRSTTTHARRAPMSSSVLWSGRRFCSTTRVLPQAPQSAIRWKWQGVVSPCLCRPLGIDNLLAKRWCAAYGGTRRWPRRMSHRPTDAAAEREILSLCRQGRTPSSAPPFSRRSSRYTSAGPSSPNGRLTVAVAQIGRHPSERAPRHPARVAQIVARCPAPPTRSSSLRRLHRPASTPGNAAGAPPSPLRQVARYPAQNVHQQRGR